MFRIGLILGKDDFYDYISKKNFERLLPQIKNAKKFLMNKDYYSTDIKIVLEILKRHPNIEVKLYLPREITLEKLEQNDVNYLLGSDLVNAFYNKTYNKLRSIYKNKNSKIFPTLPMQDFILKKGKYYEYLYKKGIPIAPTFTIYSKNKNRNAKWLVPKLLKLGWNDFITKPILSAWGIGFKKWSLDKWSDDRWNKYINDKKIKRFPGIIVQKLIPGFIKHYEIRTFWIDGKYVSAIGNIKKDYDHVIPEHRINKNDLENCKRIAKKTIQVLPKFKFKNKIIKPIFLRIDLGCCYPTNPYKRNYFINEIEGQAANLFAEFMNQKLYRIFADSIIKKTYELYKIGFFK